MITQKKLTEQSFKTQTFQLRETIKISTENSEKLFCTNVAASVVTN